MEKVKVLFIAANPIASEHLHLDEEIHEVTEKVNAAKWHDHIEIICQLAARWDDLIQALHRHRPHILHFSGHGSRDGDLILLDKNGAPTPVTPEAMADLVEVLNQNLRLVLFNICVSETQARAVVKKIDCAIGMTSLISDPAAIQFSAAFYQAIAFGQSIYQAFLQGKAAMGKDFAAEKDKLVLYEKTGADAQKIFLISPDEIEEQKQVTFASGDEHDFLAQIDLTTVKRLTVLSHTGRRIYDAIHQVLERLIQDQKPFPEEVRIITRTPVVEGIFRNNYIHNTLVKINSLRRINQKNIDVRLYESVPAFRGIMCEFRSQNRRKTYISTYQWKYPNMSKANTYGFVVEDTVANPHPLVSMYETWVEQYWGRDEIHTLAFDFDDTLIFSGEVQIKAWAMAVEDALQKGLVEPGQLSEAMHYDKDLAVNENQAMLKAIQKIFISQQMAEKILEAMFVNVDPKILDEINRLRFGFREKLMSQARVFDGVEKMLERLRVNHNFAIITSTDEQMVYDYLSAKGLIKFFPLIMGKRDPLLKQEHENIHHKASLLIKLSEIIGIPLSRMAYIGDNHTDYLATRQIGIPFIEARQAARLIGEKSFVHPDPTKLPFGYFDSYENDKLPDLLRDLSLEVTNKKFQMPGS